MKVKALFIAVVVALILAAASPGTSSIISKHLYDSVLSGVKLKSAPWSAHPTVAYSTQSKILSLTGPAEIPFKLVNKHIVLTVRVDNSRPLSFVLDTGDQFAVIDLARARELNLKLGSEVRVGGAGAATAAGAMVENSSFTISGFDGFSQRVAMALPISSLSSRLGQDFDGIIGRDFIQEFVVEVDYQRGVLRLHDKQKFVYKGPGESVPIQLVTGHPILEAEVQPIGGTILKGKFVLDLGAGLALALYSPFVNEHQLLNPNIKTIRSMGGAGAGGETKGRIGRVSQLKVGNLVINNPITMFSEDKAGAFASSSLAGNIGARIAERFRVFLDYAHMRIILEPNSDFMKPFDQAFSGASFVAEGPNYKTFRVRVVLENSPASEVGLQKGDVIIEVNGQDAAELTLSELNDMLTRPIAYDLLVQRGEQRLRLKLKPRQLI